MILLVVEVQEVLEILVVFQFVVAPPIQLQLVVEE